MLCDFKQTNRSDVCVETVDRTTDPDRSSSRLLPGLDDDEVESPPFSFERFERLMAQAYLANIRDPAAFRCNPHDWITTLAPHWRWARAHSLLRLNGRAYSGAVDDPAWAAFELLCCRAHGTGGSHRDLVDAVLIFERNDRLRWLLESHLLLPVVTSDLSSKLGLSPTTIEYYGLWFFDVRSRLSKSGWISGWVLGGTPWNGFADDDLAPVWRRMAYHSRNERVLDVTVAVTTGAGRDRFPEAECDRIQYLVEQMRLSPAIDPDRVLQIARRLEAERNGEPPSSYHVPRKSRVPAPARLRADPHAIPAS